MDVTRIRALLTEALAELGKSAPVQDGIDYGAFRPDERGRFQYRFGEPGLPPGFDFAAWAKHWGVADPMKVDTRGNAIEEVEGRQYVNRAHLDLDGVREALLNLPGVVTIHAARPVTLFFQHGSQSRGLVTAVANGLNIGHGPDYPLGPGDYVVDFSGEPGAARLAVKIKPSV